MCWILYSHFCFLQCLHKQGQAKTCLTCSGSSGDKPTGPQGVWCHTEESASTVVTGLLLKGNTGKYLYVSDLVHYHKMQKARNHEKG